MKRIISLFTVFVLLVSLATPVCATTIVETEMSDMATIVDKNGSILQFELIETTENNYTMYYYVDGVLTRSYSFTLTSNIIQVYSVCDSNTYTIQNDTVTCTEEVASVAEPKGSSITLYTSLGYIYYDYSSAYDYEPYAHVCYRITSRVREPYVVNAYTDTYIDELVAIVTQAVILYFTPIVTVSLATTIASALLAEMIAANGAEIVNGLISIPFTDEYYCTTTNYEMRADVYVSDETSHYNTFTGKMQTVTYDSGYKETYYSGYTPNNWDTLDFAEVVWDDCVPFWPSFPGLIGFS